MKKKESPMKSAHTKGLGESIKEMTASSAKKLNRTSSFAKEGAYVFAGTIMTTVCTMRDVCVCVCVCCHCHCSSHEETPRFQCAEVKKDPTPGKGMPSCHT